MIWPSGFRQNMIADYIFNLCAGGGFFLNLFILVGAGPAALGEAGTGSSFEKSFHSSQFHVGCAI